MRVLLDECLPRPLKGLLTPHDVATGSESGWAGIKNGRLLELAAGRFDLFVTLDQNLQYQQNLAGHAIAVIVLISRSSRLADLTPKVPKLLEILDRPLDAGSFATID